MLVSKTSEAQLLITRKCSFGLMHNLWLMVENCFFIKWKEGQVREERSTRRACKNTSIRMNVAVAVDDASPAEVSCSKRLSKFNYVSCLH